MQVPQVQAGRWVSGDHKDLKARQGLQARKAIEGRLVRSVLLARLVRQVQPGHKVQPARSDRRGLMVCAVTTAHLESQVLRDRKVRRVVMVPLVRKALRALMDRKAMPVRKGFRVILVRKGHRDQQERKGQWVCKDWRVLKARRVEVDSRYFGVPYVHFGNGYDGLSIQPIHPGFTVPAGVTTLFVEVWGGGGGGGARSPNGTGGGPGGAGGYSSGKLTVTGGEQLQMLIGTGGGGGFWNNHIWESGRGGAGGLSQIGNIVAGGGSGGNPGGDPDLCSADGGAGGSGDNPGLSGQPHYYVQHLPGVNAFGTNLQIFGPGSGGWSATDCSVVVFAEHGTAGLPGLIRISW